jgi:hypothetical protein
MRLRSMLIAAALLAAASLAATPGFAQSQTTTMSVDLNAGDPTSHAASAPEFHMDFLLDDAARLGAVPPGTTQNLEISMTSPNNSVFHFMFSPRPQIGIGFDPVSGTNRAYAGLTWNLFAQHSFYGGFGLAGSFDPGLGGSYDPMRREAFEPLEFHGALELGYRFEGAGSLSASFDQGVIPISHGSGSSTFDDFLLRYGQKF